MERYGDVTLEKRYIVNLELTTNQAVKIMDGLDALIAEDQKIIKKYPHILADPWITNHLHEVMAVREYFRERYNVSKEILDENNSES